MVETTREPRDTYLVTATMRMNAARHRANIVRLAQGRENKVGAKKQ